MYAIIKIRMYNKTSKVMNTFHVLVFTSMKVFFVVIVISRLVVIIIRFYSVL